MMMDIGRIRLKKILIKSCGILLVLSGIGLYLSPFTAEWMLERQTQQYIETFKHRYGYQETDEAGSDKENRGGSSVSGDFGL